MINLQEPQDYEDSLNNILNKAPLEAGVERVVITLLNDILSYLRKWPELSAEDTSKLKRKDVNDKYYGFTEMLTLSTPDGMILGDSQAQSGKGHIHPYVLIEVKDLATYQNNDEFIGSEADTVIQELKKKLKNESDIKDSIKEILSVAFNLPEGGSKVLKKNKWEVEVLSKKDTDGAYPIEIIDPSKKITDPSRTVATLHQLDTYILDCYLDENIKGVIWTNGFCWKIWKKDDSGDIDSGLANPPITLDPSRSGNVQIDPIKFRGLIDKLISFFSTL